MLPGLRQQTVTPYSRPSRAATWLRPHKPCLEAEYAALLGRTRLEEIEPMLIIRPARCCFMIASAALVQTNGPRRLVAITRSQASIGKASRGPPSNAPALLTS